jgi:hypothetical protein
MAAATATVLLAARGWRRGESWVWWTVAVASGAGYLPALVVHAGIGYVDATHLAPPVLGAALTTVALALARPYLCAPAVAVPHTVLRWQRTRAGV